MCAFLNEWQWHRRNSIASDTISIMLNMIPPHLVPIVTWVACRIYFSVLAIEEIESKLKCRFNVAKVHGYVWSDLIWSQFLQTAIILINIFYLSCLKNYLYYSWQKTNLQFQPVPCIGRKNCLYIDNEFMLCELSLSPLFLTTIWL